MKEQKVLAYLTSSYLTFQTQKKVLKSIALSEKQLNDASLFQEQLTLEIKDIIKELSEVILVLGDGMLLQRALGKDDNKESAEKELVNNSGFLEKDVKLKTIETSSKIYLLVTNKSLYQSFRDILSEFGISLTAVLPLSLFSDKADKKSLSKADIEAVIKNEDLYAVGNFIEEGDNAPTTLAKKLEDTKISDDGENGTLDDISSSQPTRVLAYRRDTQWNTSRLLMLLGFLIILTVLMGGLIYLQQTRESLLQPEPTPVPTATPTPTPELALKPELTILVLNGSGTPGQASSVQETLEGAEFTNITVDNAETEDTVKTEVVFSSRVSGSIKDEVKELLLETFTAVTTRTDSAASTDIVITTGEEK